MNTLIVRESTNKYDIILNDAYFEHMIDSYIENGYESIVKDCIEHIDECEYLGDFKIRSKITDTPISILEVSTGCKTVINVLCNRDKIVNISSCGINALAYLLEHDEITAGLDGFIPLKSLNCDLSIINEYNTDKISNIEEYYEYWGAYYEKSKH